MASCDGIAAPRAIRELGGPTRPVVAVTADALDGSAARDGIS